MKQKKVLGLAALALGALSLAGVPRVMADDTTATAPAAGATMEKSKHDKHMMDADAMLKKMTGKLTLTQDEQDKIKPILTDEATQMNGMDASLTKEQRKSKGMEIQKTASDQIYPLLTTDQQKKFDKQRAKTDAAAAKKDAPK